MRFKTFLLTVLMLSTGTYAAISQEGQTLRLSLTEAQQYAVEHNQSMQNATLEVKNAELQKWKTFASMLPQVSAAFDYQNMCGYAIELGPGMRMEMNPSGSLNVTASIALTGAQIVGTKLQSLAMEMSDITRQQTEQTTRSNVKNVYVSILVMEQTVGLLDSSLTNLERLAATSQASVDVGAAEQVDADKLQVQVASMRTSISSTKRSLQMLRNSMLLQLGADVSSKLELTTSVNDILSVDNAVNLLNEQFDIEKNFNYRLLAQNEKIAKQNINMAYADFAPTISAYYQYSYKTYFGKNEGFNMTPPNMIGASVKLPIFSSGTRMAGVKSAKLQYQEMLNSKQQAEDGLKVQFNQLRYDLVSALETYQIQTENLDVTKRVFDNLAEKYKFGRASSLEVTTASTDIITAQSNYIQAVMSVISAQVALENLLNK